MQVYTKRELDKIVELMTQGMQEAGFTGIKIERADLPQASWDAFTEEDEEEDKRSLADLSSELVYHRVTTDQGSFGLWLQPYPTVDICCAGLDLKSFFPPGQDLSALPSDWGFIGMDEDIFKQLFGEFAKAGRKP